MGQLRLLTPRDRALAIEDDPVWQELLARYDLVSSAAWLAWDALFDAYRPALRGHGPPAQALLEKYHYTSAKRLEAEKALVDYIRERVDEDERGLAMAAARTAMRRSSSRGL